MIHSDWVAFLVIPVILGRILICYALKLCKYKHLSYIASTKLMILRHNDKVLPEYLFALLKSNYVIAELQHLAETRSGTFPQITFSSELAPMKVHLPDKDTQNRIVSVLSSIELKIDENIAINNYLF